MKTAILLLTWGRPQNLERTLLNLNSQTVKDFDLIVSNSNRDHDKYLERKLKITGTKYPVHYRRDSNDRLGFRRFDIARELSYDRYIFLDDDVDFRQNLTQDMFNQYEPKTYHSWYCFTIHSDDYHDRTRVISNGQPIHYAGTGISMIDRAIVDRDELFDHPPAALYIEDLWLTYVVDHVYGWQLKNLKIPRIKLGGGDSVALYKRVRNMDYTKRDLYRDLCATGWHKKRDPLDN